MYPYSTPPPPGWSTYDYTTSPPPTSPHYAYYASQFASPYVSPRGSSKRHGRKASYAGPTKESAGWYPPSYPTSHGFYEPMPDFSPRSSKHDHVSASRRRTMSGAAGLDGYVDASRPSPAQKRHVFVDVVDDVFDDAPRYVVRDRRPGAPPTTPSSDRRPRRPSFSYHHRKPKPPTDHYFYYNQVPTYDDVDSAKQQRARARRQSTSTRNPSKPKPSATLKPAPKATEEDAERAGIPAGSSIKNWDPTDAPIVLLGSVFDANSLGKWVYDWTVFHHGASTPMADVAGDLWLLLIKLAGKIKRADESVGRIKHLDAQETVEDFLESGERLWSRVKKLLKACETFMWKAAKRENGGKATVSMGRNAGCEFVDSIFGRDRELENTEKLMNSIRLWNMRFDANCEDILRRPSAN